MANMTVESVVFALTAVAVALAANPVGSDSWSRATIGNGVAGVGQAVTINIAHNAANNLYQVSSNGQLSYTDRTPPRGSFGCDPINIAWTDIHF